MTHLDLFSGIGGFALAAERVWPDIEHVFCEIDPFCRTILKKHWPNSYMYGDIKWLASATEAWYNPSNLCQYHALIVKKNPKQPIPIGERNASQKHNTTGCTEALKDEKSTINELGKQQQGCVNWLSTRMVASADVAEKKNRPSLLSTIPTEEEQGKEGICSVCNFIENSVIVGSQTDIESSAITAIMELTDSVYVHTRNVDLLTGGFPCQGFSQAGKRRGTADARWLWPEMYRIIRATSPRFVVAENVRGFLNWEGGVAFKQVLADLENAGYETVPVLLPACAVGAPHRRDRVWIVAHATGVRCDGWDDKGEGIQRSNETRREVRTGDQQADAPNPEGAGQRSEQEFPREGQEPCGDHRARGWDEGWPQVATRLCRMDDGLPQGVSRPRGWRNAALKAYGNAIVPQVAEQIFRAIKHA